MQEQVQYEVINKLTGEISPVSDMIFGEGYVDVTIGTVSGVVGVRFQNPNKDGNLVHENDQWAIRQVGTDLTPNDDGVVSDGGVETPISPEQASQIMNDAHIGVDPAQAGADTSVQQPQA